MAGLRKGHCYSKLTRAYTRYSRVKAKNYIKTIPTSKVVRFNMGDQARNFEYEIALISNKDHQIRHNALESSRQLINRRLYEKLGPKGYFLKLKIYPYQVLRENKMLGGAHADRLQTGMAHSFGKPVGLAARAQKGKEVFIAKVDKNGLDIAKEALTLAKPRMPGKYLVNVKKL
ncbi:MAG: 50S ribosomal protein L10e [archaeon GW2011_AR20]|nr:MAG: 50S ribosomal protein L10e [archaeon GW2011_AR20]MBS3160823.1 50S ribosomal protein L16 [Candidatus Woesearchaeota archaeon]